jgi:hypothetical protein
VSVWFNSGVPVTSTVVATAPTSSLAGTVAAQSPGAGIESMSLGLESRFTE